MLGSSSFPVCALKYWIQVPRWLTCCTCCRSWGGTFRRWAARSQPGDRPRPRGSWRQRWRSAGVTHLDATLSGSGCRQNETHVTAKMVKSVGKGAWTLWRTDMVPCRRRPEWWRRSPPLGRPCSWTPSASWLPPWSGQLPPSDSRHVCSQTGEGRSCLCCKTGGLIVKGCKNICLNCSRVWKSISSPI